MSDLQITGKRAGTLNNTYTLAGAAAIAGIFFGFWSWDSNRRSELEKTVQAQAELRNQVANVQERMAALSSTIGGMSERMAQGLAPIPTMQERFANAMAYMQPIPGKIAEMDRLLIALQSQAAVTQQALEKSLQEADRRSTQTNEAIRQLRDRIFDLGVQRRGSNAPDLPTLNGFPSDKGRQVRSDADPIPVTRQHVSGALRALALPGEPQWSVVARVCFRSTEATWRP